jgi:nucleotide-binding universal stress UspA family protein
VIKRILVGLGGTPITPVAVREAVDLAARHGAELTGVTVVDTRESALVERDPPESGVLVQSRLAQLSGIGERIDRAIDDFELVAAMAGVCYRVVHETGEPFERMIDLARFHDLTVCGLNKLLKYEFAPGRPLDMLVRFMTSGVQPILSVTEMRRPIKRVLIAFSGSAESTRAMKRWVQMRLFPTAELRVVSFGPAFFMQPLVDASVEYCKAHGYTVAGHTVDAEAKEALLDEAADYDADLIVLGSSARKTFLRRMLGDTALQIISEAQIPLFVCQ